MVDALAVEEEADARCVVTLSLAVGGDHLLHLSGGLALEVHLVPIGGYNLRRELVK